MICQEKFSTVLFFQDGCKKNQQYNLYFDFSIHAPDAHKQFP